MRKILRNSSEVFHFWANKVQSEGRAGNVFFDGDKVYSYGSHFCIARHLPTGAVAFTTRSYSPTTSGHVSEARSAARHLRKVYCNDPSDNARVNMQHARNAIRDALSDAEKPRIRQTTRDAHKARALHIAEQANAYLAALPEIERGTDQPIDTGALEAVRESLNAIERARAQIAAEQQAARVADLQESLEQWRTGFIHSHTHLSYLPVALRMGYREQYKGAAGYQVIETSHGAEIPVDAAKTLWPVIQKIRAGGADWLAPAGRMRVGDYVLNTIRADGSIVVGCHDIPYSEIEAIAKLLEI